MQELQADQGDRRLRRRRLVGRALGGVPSGCGLRLLGRAADVSALWRRRIGLSAQRSGAAFQRGCSANARGGLSASRSWVRFLCSCARCPPCLGSWRPEPRADAAPAVSRQPSRFRHCGLLAPRGVPTDSRRACEERPARALSRRRLRDRGGTGQWRDAGERRGRPGRGERGHREGGFARSTAIVVSWPAIPEGEGHSRPLRGKLLCVDSRSGHSRRDRS